MNTFELRKMAQKYKYKNPGKRKGRIKWIIQNEFGCGLM